MRVISEVSIQERYRQPLPAGLKGYFQDPGFDPKYIERDSRKRKFIDGIRIQPLLGRWAVGFAKEEILARDAILGKKTAFGKLQDGRSSGWGLVVKKKSGIVGSEPPPPPPSRSCYL